MRKIFRTVALTSAKCPCTLECALRSSGRSLDSIWGRCTALYVFMAFTSNYTDHSDGVKTSAITELLIKAVGKAIHSENGHLDLFFLILPGISLNSNQALLRGLITPLENSYSKQEAVTDVQQNIRENLASEKSISLFHCLNDLNDQSLEEEVQVCVKKKVSSVYHQSSKHPERLCEFF